ncbi:SulP family inorganic anion transporter [Streptomyces scabiei]|uniref:SulP family inorganic anion transporter n=1 Tax=Streptomyces scabiei TaxID=1930 RepID=UPI001B30BD43|nr:MULTISPECIES: SulP family inorganic anion transporter [Streptomyces]MBP5871450.1 SulP family inorganic anion transporter [Streptomyces sp. LBUM 1485]MBP5912574.1 SulP family inorganic anion transporter [Streptomyces sp. LBUM 1486]MDX3029362.1 SulP family inorganic anion transporter [Streptomyces scabiei]MDX3207968.1 SulP family inorganic anion transporter [Streptomyces scabiei]QTU57972.1 SulP family inorganic anion transporter [Streptomyces sp. LBUM 1480]
MTSAINRAKSRLAALLPARADLAAVRRAPRRDLLAGLTVAIVALPLALGFGVSSGLGAEAGLATAVVAGALAAVFGGSNLQVSGPTGAMTVVLVPIVGEYGPTGVLTVGLMAGIMLVALAALQAGKYMQYVPAPVVEGFTLGIACVIGLQQVPNALGVPKPEGDRVLVTTWRAVAEFAKHPHWTAVGLATAVAAVMLIGARWRPTVPFSIVAVIAATVVTQVAGLDAAQPIGDLPSGLPAPSLGFLDVGSPGSLLAPAVAVAALAALESLLSASVADGMTVGQKHDPDRELFGQGLANIAAPLFGGVPATGAIARTAVNVRTGAGSRLAALTHAAILALIVFAAAPLVSKIPLAALAGVLLATAIRMVEVGSLRAMARATRSDALILALTAVATLALDLVYAVIIGLVVAGALALRAVAKQARLDQVPLDRGDHSAEEHALLAEHIVAYRIDGPLFFAAAHRFLLELTDVADVRVVILRMSRVSTMDATGALVLKDAVEKLTRRGILVLASGIRTDQRQVLDSVGALELLRHEDREYATTPEAILAARDHLAAAGVLPALPAQYRPTDGKTPVP